VAGAGVVRRAVDLMSVFMIVCMVFERLLSGGPDSGF